MFRITAAANRDLDLDPPVGLQDVTVAVARHRNPAKANPVRRTAAKNRRVHRSLPMSDCDGSIPRFLLEGVDMPLRSCILQTRCDFCFLPMHEYLARRQIGLTQPTDWDWNRCDEKALQTQNPNRQLRDTMPVGQRKYIYDTPSITTSFSGRCFAAETKVLLAVASSVVVDGKPGWYFEPACGTQRLISHCGRRVTRCLRPDLNWAVAVLLMLGSNDNGQPIARILRRHVRFLRASFQSVCRVHEKKHGPGSASAFNPRSIVSARPAAKSKHAGTSSALGRPRPGPAAFISARRCTYPTTASPPSETKVWSARRMGILPSTRTCGRSIGTKKKRLETVRESGFRRPHPSGQFSDQRLNLRLRSYHTAAMRSFWIAASAEWECVATHVIFCYA